MSSTTIKLFRNVLTLLVLFLLLYIYNDADCEGDDCNESTHPLEKVQEKSTKKPETMHLMTVSCGRPNYQVKYILGVQSFGENSGYKNV